MAGWLMAAIRIGIYVSAGTAAIFAIAGIAADDSGYLTEVLIASSAAWILAAAGLGIHRYRIRRDFGRPIR